jgi:hypothetical protein
VTAKNFWEAMTYENPNEKSLPEHKIPRSLVPEVLGESMGLNSFTGLVLGPDTHSYANVL